MNDLQYAASLKLAGIISKKARVALVTEDRNLLKQVADMA